VPYEDAPGAVVHFCDQPEVVALDVENSKFPNAVCGRKIPANFFNAFPLRPLRHAEPRIDRPC